MVWQAEWLMDSSQVSPELRLSREINDASLVFESNYELVRFTTLLLAKMSALLARQVIL